MLQAFSPKFVDLKNSCFENDKSFGMYFIIFFFSFREAKTQICNKLIRRDQETNR
jgi:hypothetical protein